MENGMTKYCQGCKETLPIYAFGIDRSRDDGLNRRCRVCIRTRQRRVIPLTPKPKPNSILRDSPRDPLERVRWAIDVVGVRSRDELMNLLRHPSFRQDDVMDCYATLRLRKEVRRLA